MRNIKVRYFWIFAGILLALAVGLIIIITRVDASVSKGLTIALIVIFVILTFVIQYASFRSFNYRHKKKIKYPTKEFVLDADFEDNYFKLGYKKTKREYGNSYLKISNKVAYKILIVKDINAYYNHSEETKEGNKQLDNCKSFIGIEIFDESTKESLEKVVDYSFQVEKVYYTALVLKEDGNYKCLNYIEPLENHKEPLNIILKDLGAEEVILNVEEN